MRREEAENILMLASEMNHGPWIEHSKKVAKLAECIACKVGIDSEKAYVLGLLHDIGRRGGEMKARHTLEGYRYLNELGYGEEARICLTHTFQYKNVEGIYDLWDCDKSDVDFIESYLKNIEYNDYDKLIQLCDSVSLATGYCYIEKKMVSSVLKYGFNDITLKKWRAIFALRDYFENILNCSIYDLVEV